MNKKNAKNCWEYMKCPDSIKLKCAAFTNNMGRECFFIPNIKKVCPYAKKHGGCDTCPWYKKLNNK